MDERSQNRIRSENNENTLDFSEKNFVSITRWLYIYMIGAMIMSAIISHFIVDTNYFIKYCYNYSLVWFLMEVVIAFFLSSKMTKINFITAVIVFITYSILNSITISSIFYDCGFGKATTFFLIIAGVYAVLEIIELFKNIDLNKISSAFIMLSIGIIISEAVFLLFNDNLYSYLVSLVAICIYSVMTIYDFQKKEKYYKNIVGTCDAAIKKISLLCATEICLDFISFFVKLFKAIMSKTFKSVGKVLLYVDEDAEKEREKAKMSENPWLK